MRLSYWLDQRDVPDSRFGKYRLPGCECTSSFTCRVCLAYAHGRNTAEIQGGGVRVVRRVSATNKDKSEEADGQPKE